MGLNNLTHNVLLQVSIVGGDCLKKNTHSFECHPAQLERSSYWSNPNPRQLFNYVALLPDDEVVNSCYYGVTNDNTSNMPI